MQLNVKVHLTIVLLQSLLVLQVFWRCRGKKLSIVTVPHVTAILPKISLLKS